MIDLTADCLQVIKKRPQDSHKGTFGRAVLIGGNQQFGGAILMSAESCVRSGCGLTTVVTDSVNHAPLHARLPEVMTVDWNDQSLIQEVVTSADILLIGPGLGLEKRSEELLTFIISQQTKQQRLVIDGSAITLLAQKKWSLTYPAQTIFTPHQMEWQRLSGLRIAEQNPQNNQLYQKKLQATIVLKSHRTEIYSQTACYRNPLGNPAMATGGTGDTLAGMITGFLAQFKKEDTTINAAVYLHSFIADHLAKENYVILPTEISRSLPYWMKKFEN
ncbi:MAG TPA: NAD(P)H-hydrate dehydratase [Tetragenococcus sp.]|nr:NAD(P)H-hydrate dehydratase [Tetragenococcus sp.]